ncbi:MAG TPA: AEC family transporter [Capillimicrobium sp.]
MIALVVATIVAAVAVGVAIERRSPLDAQLVAARLVKAMIWAGIPFATFFVMARLELTAGLGVGLLIAYASIAVVGGLAYLAGTRLLRLPRPSVGALVLVVILANTGYLGVPLNATLLGEDAIAPALAFDTVVSGPMFWLFGFALGAAFGDHGARTTGDRLRGVLVNPPLIAVVAGLLAGQVGGESLAPDVLLEAAHVVVYALLPCGFVLVGIALATEADEGALAFPPRFDAAVGVALALRLVAAPALMLAGSAIIGGVPDAYLLQAAMPCGINSLVVAHAAGLDLRLCAAAVTWTTAAVVLVGVAAGFA